SGRTGSSCTIRSFRSRICLALHVALPIFGEGKDMAAISRMNFKIFDDLSGIRSFNGYIDGEWVLMEYDSKSASLWHVFEKSIPKGKHQFRLEVVDWKDNRREYEISFFK